MANKQIILQDFSRKVNLFSRGLKEEQLADQLDYFLKLGDDDATANVNSNIISRIINKINSCDNKRFNEELRIKYGIGDVNTIVDKLVALSKSANISSCCANNYVIAIDKIVSEIAASNKNCGVIDVYLKYATIIFMMYIYFYDKDIFAGTHRTITSKEHNFYNRFMKKSGDQDYLDKVYDFSRCYANVRILEDIFFGNINEVMLNREIAYKKTVGLYEITRIIADPNEANEFIKINMAGSVYDHIFAAIKAISKDGRTVYKIVQSYMLNYCPQSEEYSLEEFAEMLVDLYSIYYNVEVFPHKHKLGLMDERDEEIWQKYFKASIASNVDKYNKMYIWYADAAINSAIVNINGVLYKSFMNLIKNDQLTTDIAQSVGNPLPYFLKNGRLYRSTISANIYSALFTQLYNYAFDIVENLVEQFLSVGNSIDEKHVYNYLLASFDNVLHDKIIEIRNLAQAKYEDIRLFIAQSLPSLIPDATTIFKNRKPTPLTFEHANIPSHTCYQNLQKLLTVTETEMMPMIKNLRSDDAAVKKFREIMGVKNASYVSPAGIFYREYFIPQYETLVTIINVSNDDTTCLLHDNTSYYDKYMKYKKKYMEQRNTEL